MRGSTKKNNKAFTLVEMLAVIVILGLLVAISFPKILEMVDKQKSQITEAQLDLIYSAAKSYLFDNSNQFPAREGNNYCIKIQDLENQNYLAIETDDIDTTKVVKASYFSDDEYQLTYVKESDCSDNGGVKTELAGLLCTVNKSGYSLDKVVTVTFPSGENLKYEYSTNEGKDWNTITSFDEGNKSYFRFYENGSILAKVTDTKTSVALSCSAYIDQIDPTPIGTIVAYAGKKVPKGYLLADGSSVSRTDYAELYNIVGTTYGKTGTGKFVLPNLKGKSIASISSSDTAFDTLGETGGEKLHLLTQNEMPAHTHAYSGTILSSGAHTHTFTSGGSAIVVNATTSHAGMALANGFSNASGSGWFYNSNKNISSIATTGGHTHTYSGTTHSTGGTGHNNLQPYITLNYIIKYQ